MKNIFKIAYWSILILLIFISMRFFKREISNYQSFSYQDGYEDLANDCKILTCLLENVTKPIKQDKFMMLYYDCFNKSQENVIVEIDSMDFIFYKWNRIIQKGALSFTFDKDGYLQRIHRNELELVNYSNDIKYIPSPPISFIFGNKIYLKKEISWAIQHIHLLFPILFLILTSIGYYILYEFRNKSIYTITKSLITQVLALILIIFSIFLYNHYTNLMLKHTFSEPRIYEIENLAYAFQRIMLIPALLFDILIVNILLMFHLFFKYYKELNNNLPKNV